VSRGRAALQGHLSVYDPRYQTDRSVPFPANPFLADDPRYARERYTIGAGRVSRITLDVGAAGAAVGRDRGLATYAAEKGASGKPRTALNTLVRRG
jgi:hypothetical protein